MSNFNKYLDKVKKINSYYKESNDPLNFKAKDVLNEIIFKNDFDKGEFIIKSAITGFNRHWPEGEEAILKLQMPIVLHFIIKYAQEVIKGRWKKGEERLLEIGDNDYIIKYAQRIIKGPWPEGEEKIIKNGNKIFIDEYNKFVASLNNIN